ncbi:sigma factor-like helix-turn-helix DNA-binding protein [Nakamurella lactea]
MILRFYLDWSTERTAHELGISVGAVRSSTHRAIQSLKLWMARDTDEHR